MNRILFIDTETTGMLNFKAPADHPSQPHLVQFAAILTLDQDITGEFSGIVALPLGVEIPPEATAVHGITTERVRGGSVSRKAALDLLDDLAMSATRIVAHNADFDCGVIACLYQREGRVGCPFAGSKLVGLYADRYCTMKASTDLCKLPGPYGYKWPKLIELHQHLFNEGFDKAHDALADVRACMRCYFKLQDLLQKAEVAS